MKYRVFTNDVGPSGFSCFGFVEANSDGEAKEKAAVAVIHFAPVKVVAIPDGRNDLYTGGTDPRGIRFSPEVFRKYGAIVKRSQHSRRRAS